jgi:hypothetical protein
MDHNGNDNNGWIHDDSKNPWRPMQGNDSVIEIFIPNSGRITLIDAHRHVEVASLRWNTNAIGYVVTTMWNNGEPKTHLMHIFLFPDIPAPRDHINRNTHDNRAVNVRNGSGGLNVRNQELDDGGVVTDEGKRAYVARWTGFNGQVHVKYFLWKRFKDLPAAKAAAAEYRKIESGKAEAQIIALQNEQGGGVARIERYVPKKQSSNTGVKNLCMTQQGSRISIAGTIIINKKTYRKNFNLAEYGSKEAAIEAGKEWIANLKCDNPQLPKKAQNPSKKPKITDALEHE